ncbi:MAG: hypothetical protein GY841_15350 [FCB group bacterium]|nr:hypothetical protein [FCB group bacterium]
MTITSIIKKAEMGAAGSEATFVTLISFVGAADYGDGGVDENLLLQAAVGKPVTPIGIVPARTVGANPLYEPRIVMTPAAVDSAAASFPTADQDTKTITYKLNGGAEQTLTLSGAHTTAAHLAASIEAVAGLHAYVIASGQVRVKTLKNSASATIEITGGTANAVYLFSTDEAVGSDTTKLLVINVATGLDIGYGSSSAVDLSGSTFECILLSE